MTKLDKKIGSKYCWCDYMANGNGENKRLFGFSRILL